MTIINNIIIPPANFHTHGEGPILVHDVIVDATPVHVLAGRVSHGPTTEIILVEDVSGGPQEE